MNMLELIRTTHAIQKGYNETKQTKKNRISIVYDDDDDGDKCLPFGRMCVPERVNDEYNNNVINVKHNWNENARRYDSPFR